MSHTARRLIITGGSGTLGGPLTVRATEAGWTVAATYFIHPERVRAGEPFRLDLRDSAALRALVAEFRPDAIIHTALSERSGDGYADAIRLAGRNIAQVAANSSVRLIALSTDRVFDGTQPIYTEDSPPTPLGDYGTAKRDAERDILAICPAALVVRTSLIYDFDPGNPQVAWMLRALDRGEPLRLFTDQMRCPVWAWNLADALLELAETDAAGLLHVVGPERISRYDLGVALLSALGYDPEKHVIPTPAPDTDPKVLNLSINRARDLLARTRLLTVDEARTRRD